jgi:hypothetical protein
VEQLSPGQGSADAGYRKFHDVRVVHEQTLKGHARVVAPGSLRYGSTHVLVLDGHVLDGRFCYCFQVEATQCAGGCQVIFVTEVEAVLDAQQVTDTAPVEQDFVILIESQLYHSIALEELYNFGFGSVKIEPTVWRQI